MGHRVYIGALFALIAARVLLVYDPPLSARWLPHDDLLFVQHAAHIAAGNWLGPYDELTLVRPPGYPLFIAATFFFLVLFQDVLGLVKFG